MHGDALHADVVFDGVARVDDADDAGVGVLELARDDLVLSYVFKLVPSFRLAYATAHAEAEVFGQLAEVERGGRGP